MPVTLIPVADEAQEQALLSTLERSGPSEARLVPVLSIGSLRARLERLLALYEVPFRVHADARDAGLDMGHPSHVATAGAGLGAIVTSPAISPSLSRLASVLSGAPRLELSQCDAELSKVLDGRPSSALLLFDPQKTNPDHVLRFARQATSLGIRWGLVFADDPQGGRLGILKSLLVDRAPARGTFELTSTAYGMPPLRANNLIDLTGRAERRPDILLMTGHANMLDASINAEAVLCAREGYEGSGADSLPSCFNGGRCYRQPHDGPQRRLMGLDDLTATVIVLSGCNVLPLGKGWCRSDATLAYQAGRSDAMALITPSAVSMGNFELDVLCLALLREGRSAGEVVAEINRVRRDHLRQMTGLPDDVGPFFLVGNPELRLAPIPTPLAAGDELPDGEHATRRLTISLGDTASGPSLVRVPLARSTKVPYIHCDDTQTKSWARGLYYEPEGDDPCLYVYGGTRDGSEGGAIGFELSDRDITGPIRETATAWWNTLSFWTLYLLFAEQNMDEAGTPSTELRSLREELPELRLALSKSIGWLRAPHGMSTSLRGIEHRRRSLWKALDGWSRRVLDVLCHITRSTGRIITNGEPSFLRLSESITEGEDCPCGAQLFGQIFRTPDGAATRVHRQCYLCGSSRDEDPSVNLAWGPSPERAHASGEVLQIHLRGRTPPDRHLHLHLAPTLETWSRGRKIIGERHHSVHAPDSPLDVTLELRVPYDIASGVYPVGVVGVANGTLLYMSRSLPLRGQRAERAEADVLLRDVR